MRISDWSSDVCSSDLIYRVWQYITHGTTVGAQKYERMDRSHDGGHDLPTYLMQTYRVWRMRLKPVERSAFISVLRSEERRVGKASVSTCSSRGSQCPEKKKLHRTVEVILNDQK